MDDKTNDALSRIKGNFPKTSSQESSWEAMSPEAFELMRRNAESRLRNTGAPVKHLEKKPTRTKQWNDTMDKMTLNLKNGGMMFALIGQRGTGKTQLAVELIRYAVEQENIECKYCSVMEFFMDIKETYRGDYTTRTEAEVIRAYVKPQLLVIDEVQERGATEWEDRLLTYMVDKRYGAFRDTLLISNQTPEMFGNTIGNSILSRLQETGGIVVCDWQSFRATARG